jgi:acetyltransferase-like isoleucine patch superfamily enzyme
VAGGRFGINAYVAEGAKIFTHSFDLGDDSWVAAGAIIRGDVKIGPQCSVNPYAHIAGKVEMGKGCRIAGMVSIYGFNHGMERIDKFIKDQPTTSVGVKLHDDVWVGANAVILDGVEIGSHSVIAAGSVVTKNFGPYQVIGGNPARVIRDRREQSAPTTEGDVNVDLQPPRSRGRPLEVRNRLFNVDPYHNLKKLYAEDIQGWGSYDGIFEQSIKSLKPRLIVEVGTWKGASAIHMAKLCEQYNLSTEIVCIDTWLGNWQHWSRLEGPGSRLDLRIENGYPNLYFQFLSNVLAHKLEHVITPLPLTGVAGAKLFESFAIRPDMVYVDGDHEYQSVVMDLRLWLDQLAPGGIIIGDDYDWPGVRRAANEICEEGKWGMQVSNNKFLLKARD